MHLRISKKQRGDRFYQYAQLVESFRRPDGVPSHRVIANLGKLEDSEIENLRTALRASREGKALIVSVPLRTPEIERKKLLAAEPDEAFDPKFLAKTFVVTTDKVTGPAWVGIADKDDFKPGDG